MNCEEFRQAAATDPAFSGGAGHAAVCSDCRDYQRSMLDLNLKIARAMQIDVPPPVIPELPEVSADNVTSLPVRSRKRSKGPIWFAIAATVVLATSISLRMSGFFVSYDTLAEEVLAHLDHEPGALRVTTTPVSDKRLARVVPASTAHFDRESSLITYAQTCVINGKRIPHLVIQGERGPVTILLMPDERIDAATPLDGQSIQGVLLPVGDGSIAIIGDREEALGPIQEEVLQAVTWTT